MRKILGYMVLLLILAAVAYEGYRYFAAGLHTRPFVPDDAFSVSFKNGFLGIVEGVPDERETRRYLSVPFEVPFWAKGAWSYL